MSTCRNSEIGPVWEANTLVYVLLYYWLRLVSDEGLATRLSKSV